MPSTSPRTRIASEACAVVYEDDGLGVVLRMAFVNIQPSRQGIGSVTVERVPASVVASCRAGISVAGDEQTGPGGPGAAKKLRDRAGLEVRHVAVVTLQLHGLDALETALAQQRTGASAAHAVMAVDHDPARPPGVELGQARLQLAERHEPRCAPLPPTS